MIAQPLRNSERMMHLMQSAPETSYLECTRCGFEPEDQYSQSQRCPKCHGFSWRRVPRPGGLLAAVSRASGASDRWLA